MGRKRISFTSTSSGRDFSLWLYELVALLVVNQRAPNRENDRDPGAGRKVLEELTGANVCRADRD